MDFSSICYVCFESKTPLIETDQDILGVIKDIFRIKVCPKRFCFENILLKFFFDSFLTQLRHVPSKSVTYVWLS